MSFSIGLDIGGTKIAGAVFDTQGTEQAQIIQPTPRDYKSFVLACGDVVKNLEQKMGAGASVGLGLPFAVANMPFLMGQPLQHDIEALLQRRVRMANDANCAALSEAKDGAGAGYRSVFGLIMGTGVGGGFVCDGRIVEGANGLSGEIGHLPLPYYEPSDGDLVPCGCGQKGCIEKLTCGAALARLYHKMTGKESDAPQISALANAGDSEAVQVLDRFYTVVAKAMVAIIHTFDPHVIVVSGGLNNLPGLYDAVPKRWGDYTISKSITTRFLRAHHGAMSGLRGAAWLGASVE